MSPMPRAHVGLCTIELHLPGVTSLKEKRSILKSMLTRLHNTFNVAAAEVGHNDIWQSAVIAIVTVSNSTSYTDQIINNIINWIELHYPNVIAINEEIEIL